MRFAAERTGKTPSALDIADLDAPLIAAFLDHLERDRHNSATTRNNRLAAIHSLFGYLALHHPEHAATIQRVLAIPPKRTERNLVTYLTEPEVDALLDACDLAHLDRSARPRHVRAHHPDRAADLRTRRTHPPGRHPHRRRQRAHHRQRPQGTTHTARGTDQGDPARPGSASVPALQAIRCSRPSPAAASAATPSNDASPTTSPSPTPTAPRSKAKRVTMHTLRHTAAMRLLLAGNDVTVIALWLGHEQISTTNIYLHADMTHKQQAIDRTRPLATKPGRYRPPDTLLAFLEAL